MAQNKKATAATPSGAYHRMASRWEMFDALLGGTEAMREAGQTFLPRHDRESQKNYNNRLAKAVLLNTTEHTLNTLAGKPFKKEMVLGEDVPPAIAAYAEDIDMQGNNLQAFCRSWFREAWAKGFSHALIEHTTPKEKVDAEGNPIPRTLSDDRAENLRPYWVHIRPENLIAAYADTVHGKEVLTHIRIRETTLERDGWEERIVTRIRVLEPGTWQTYIENPAKEGEWILEDEGASNSDEIRLVTFYTSKREGLMECKPPLMDLAYLNISHWQSASDQQNVLTVARFPILAGAGVDSSVDIDVGPNNFLTTDSTDGKWYYVEHTGAAIKVGAEHLLTLEDQMATYGTEFMRNKPGTETATGKALDSAEASSYLGATVMDFKDCVEQALMFTARWMGLDNGGSVVIDANVGLTQVQAHELDALLKLRAQRDLSYQGLMNEMMRRGIMAEDFDIEADRDLLDEEAESTQNAIGAGMFGPNGTQGRQPAPQQDDMTGDE